MSETSIVAIFFLAVGLACWFDITEFYTRRPEQSIIRIFKDALRETLTMDGILIIAVSMLASFPFVVGSIKLLERSEIGYWLLHVWILESDGFDPQANISLALVAIMLMIFFTIVNRVLLLVASCIVGSTARLLRKS